MQIIIGADLVPTSSNSGLFSSGKVEELVDASLMKILNESDYRIFNLEVPLSDVERPIVKCGPNLIAPSATIAGFKALHVDLLTLANNHILDQGEKGLSSTLQALSQHNIEYVGAGMDSEQAAQPFIFSFSEKKIGVYACAEHEFSIATVLTAGANPFDPLWSFDHVSSLKEKCDYVIILYHGGKEHYRYPSPGLQKVCRRFIDKGADLVVCQHSHCIGCEEKYNNGTIVYGQGNFLFDLSESEYWQTSLLICLDENLTIQYIPLEKNGKGVRLAPKGTADIILKEFFERSEKIKDFDFLLSQYNSFAKDKRDYYLNIFKGKESFLFRVVNKLTGNKLRSIVLRQKYGSDEVLHLLNYCMCEAHSELIIKALELEINEKR